MKLLVIFNPKAAHGRSVKQLAKIKAKFERLYIEVEYLPTQSPGHGVALVAAADLSRYDGIVAAGGDGTIFEVLNGLYQHPAQARIPLGLLPIGTGNAFARDLGLQPSGWSEAIDLLHRGQTRQVDVGRVNSADGSYYFLNIVGMGFSVHVAESAHKLKFLGNAAYTLATLWKMLALKSYPLVLELDGKVINCDNVFVTISNTRYTGTHFMIAPQAEIDDGQLLVTLLEPLPRRRLLKLFPTIYSGRHIEYKEVSTYKAASIKILSPAGMQLAPDGEFMGKSPAEITCLPGDLSIFM